MFSISYMLRWHVAIVWLAKRSQHSNATLLGATCCVRLATLLRRVATCWVLLDQI